MRFALVLALATATGTVAGAQTGPHHYSRAERYAGCLVGYLIPALRRGAAQAKALAYAEDRCLPLSEGLSDRDLREVIDQVNFFVAASER